MSKFRKALVAAVGAGTAVYGFAAIFNNVIEQVGAGVAVAIVVGLGTYFIPNDLTNG